MVAKYDTNGVIQWQNILGGTDWDQGSGIAVDNAGYVYVCGKTRSTGPGSTFNALIAKLPEDGSGQGTYGDLSYQTSSLTDKDATSVTSASISLGTGGTTLTNNASGLTEATSTLPEEVIA